MGHAKAAEKLMLGEPFTGSDAVDCGIANAVLPAGEVVNHARRMAERFNALAPTAVRETKRLMREPQTRAHPRGDGHRRRAVRQPAAQPRGDGGLPGLLPEAQARLQRSSERPTRHTAAMSLAIKLALGPLLLAQAVHTRRTTPKLPEAAGPRHGECGPGAAACGC